MYQYSLDAFNTFLQKAIDRAQDSTCELWTSVSFHVAGLGRREGADRTSDCLHEDGELQEHFGVCRWACQDHCLSVGAPLRRLRWPLSSRKESSDMKVNRGLFEDHKRLDLAHGSFSTAAT